jgi:FMN-dependent NADH-azoreductase
MTTLLHIDASARVTRSLSRGLSQDFIDIWKNRRPGDTVIRRDVGLNPPPATTEAWISAVFTDPAARTPQQCETIVLSDELIDELDRADIIVLGTPMYNYGMPTALKGWVDQIVRIDKTFTFDLSRGDFPLEPIMSGKTLVLLTASGEFGFAPGGVREEMNHLIPHIRTIQHYLGVSACHHVAIEYQEFGDERHEKSVADAHAALPGLVDQLTT